MGLIHDIPSCRELVERIVEEAEGIIRGRLAGMWAKPLDNLTESYR